MDLLGPSLEDQFRARGRAFPPDKVADWGDQMVKVLFRLSDCANEGAADIAHRSCPRERHAHAGHQARKLCAWTERECRRYLPY